MKPSFASILGVVALLVLPANASAAPKRSFIYGTCGPSLCKVDAATGKKQTLLRGTRANPFHSAAISVSGKRVAFVRSGEVFLAGPNGSGARRVGTALRQAAPEVNVRPDGRELSWIDVAQRSVFCPFPPCAFELVRELNVLRTSDPPAETRIVASEMRSAGWLGTRIIRQAFGEAQAPWFICAWSAENGCIASVAVDAARALDDPAGSPDGRWVAAVALPAPPDGSNPTEVSGPIALFDSRTGARVRDLAAGANVDPAFSPDGKKVAFVRGRDLFVVSRSGGRPRRLARNVADPAWSKR